MPVLSPELKRHIEAQMIQFQMQPVDIVAVEYDALIAPLLARAVVRDKRKYHPYYDFLYLVEIRSYVNEEGKPNIKFLRGIRALRRIGQKVKTAQLGDIVTRDVLYGKSVYFAFPQVAQEKIYLFEHICTEFHIDKCKEHGLKLF
ncbi:MAG: hypothetical protein methR_P2765 [Methyloprofundus sp.]|nr:MAG: hypothetical protein methR_P2765 [Methyloprofundus sp.]